MNTEEYQAMKEKMEAHSHSQKDLGVIQLMLGNLILLVGITGSIYHILQGNAGFWRNFFVAHLALGIFTTSIGSINLFIKNDFLKYWRSKKNYET